MRSINKMLFISAVKRLIGAYMVSFMLGLSAGIFLIKFFNITPETIHIISTKRISYVNPVLEWGVTIGLDRGLVLFIWNALAALVTLSFIHTASWFNPLQIDYFPRPVRAVFCSKTKMKLLCYLPGCLEIEAESLRRLYLWLQVPFYGIILLGAECGLSITTTVEVFGSFFLGIIALLPHGIIEIPAICLAGAVPYSALLLMNAEGMFKKTETPFASLEAYRNDLPIKKITIFVMLALLVAGFVEAHVTLKIIAKLIS